MTYQPLYYLDESTKGQIKRAILFFAKSRFGNKEEIFKKLAADFNVPKTAILELAVEIARERQQAASKALEEGGRK
jgi:hypothetical protein